MTFTDIELFELEKFYNEITIPKEVWVNAATKYTDAPLFVKENMELLRTKALIPVIASQRWNMLNELKKRILGPDKMLLTTSHLNKNAIHCFVIYNL